MTRLSPEPSDVELVQRSLAGETHAFTQLVAKHQRLVFGVALSSARDPAQAEDVAQEAFVEAWRDLRRLREPARVGAWLAGIARNLARRWTRQTARRRTRDSAAVRSEPVPTPLDRTLDRETAALVHHALDEIPAAYREALVLFYMQGHSVAQVASGLGITEDLAKQRLSRGRRALRASLETRIEGALAQLGPSKSFTAAVMIAVGAATVRRASAAGKVFVAMKATKLILVAVVLVIAAALVWHSRPAPKATPAATPAAIPAATPAAEPAFASTPSSHQQPADARTPAVHRFATPQMREQLVRAIRAAHHQRTAAAGSDDTGNDDPDNDYVRDAMTDLLPAVLDCYHQARAKHPALAGTLVVDFTIEGEPGVGGVVTASAIDRDQSEIQDPDLGQCVAEAMFALEIDPPLDGVSAKVSFPFTFRPEN
jgi:RNA polymerase sigma factor (sigma-70 family)